MNYYTRRFILLATIFTVFTGMLFAAGTIKGTVVDAQTGDPLPGANVVIKELFIGTSSGLNGEFVLNNVPDGTNVITISYLGYVEQEITVEISGGETKTIEVELMVLAIQGEEAVITAQAYGQRAAINQQLAANTVVNVVSSEKIEELPDANAAEAIGRLPGVSLKRNSGEANQVVIRGLSPKYNNVTIEGIKMASTSDFDRSVDLSMIQSELLAGIEVSKSLRADMDADALGGTVNLRLLEAPNKRRIDFSAEGGYANLGNNFANYKFTGGFANRYFDKKLGVSLKAAYEQKQLPSHRFSGGYEGAYTNQIVVDGEVVDTVLDTRTQNATLTDQSQVRKRTNASVILDYKNDWWTVKFFNLFSQKNDDVVSRQFRYLFNPQGTPANFASTVNQTEWRTMTRTHTLQNSFRFGASKLDVDLSTTYAKRTQDDQGFPFIEENDYGIDQNWLVYRQPKEAIDLVGGADSLKIEDSFLQRFDKGNLSLIDQSYDVRLDYELDYAFGAVTGKLQLGGKYHQLTRTSDGTSRFSSFEWGGSVARRQAFIAMFPWVTTRQGAQRGLSAHNFVDQNYDPGTFLNGRYETAWTGDVELLTGLQDQWYEGPDDTKYYFRGVESYQRDYEATEKLTAGYIMTEINIGSKLMLLPGVRYEQNKTDYFAYHIITNDGQTGIEPNPDSVTTNRENAKWFPSLNLKYKITDFLSIQGAVYKSTSRPSFRQISPLVIYRHNSQRISANNPWLEPSTAWNFDLGVSVMKSKIGLLTAYGFYKEIEDLAFTMNNYKPIKKGEIVGGPDDLDDRLLGEEYFVAYYIDDNQGIIDQPFNNTEKAYVSGLELSWQSSFWYLPGILKGLVLDVNYTVLNTKTRYPFFQQVIIGVDDSGFIPINIYGQEYVVREGPMQDQPSSILNVILGWDYKGFSARISYRYQSETVEGLDTRYTVFDRYYDTFSLVDLMLKQQITKNISAYANLTNISNHIDDYYFGEQGDRPALPTNSQFYGFRAQLGVRVKL